MPGPLQSARPAITIESFSGKCQNARKIAAEVVASLPNKGRGAKRGPRGEGVGGEWAKAALSTKRGVVLSQAYRFFDSVPATLHLFLCRGPKNGRRLPCVRARGGWA